MGAARARCLRGPEIELIMWSGFMVLLVSGYWGRWSGAINVSLEKREFQNSTIGILAATGAGNRLVLTSSLRPMEKG
jgi:hypothetical protein